MVDSFFHTVDVGEQEILAGKADRVIVDFDRLYDSAAPEVAAVLGSPAVAGAEASLAVPGLLGGGEEGFEVLIGLVDLKGSTWLPGLAAGPAATPPGVWSSQGRRPPISGPNWAMWSP